MSDKKPASLDVPAAGREVPARPPWPLHVVLFVAAGAACVGVRLAFPSDLFTWDDTYYLQGAVAVAAGDPIAVEAEHYMHFRWALELPTALVIALTGSVSLLAYWLVALGYAFLEGGFVYLVGRRLGGWPVGAAAAALMAVHPIATNDGSLLVPDHAINAWFTMAIWALLRIRVARGRGGVIGWAALVGLFCFGAYLTRMTVILMFPALLLGLRRRRFWLPLAVGLVVVGAGYLTECAIHFSFTGDWLHRWNATTRSYEHWVEHTTLSDWTVLLTRWEDRFVPWFGAMWAQIGFIAIALGVLIRGLWTRDWRGRLLGVWFLFPTLVVMFGVRSISPVVAFLEAGVRFLAMPASAAVLSVAFAGAGLARLLGRWKAPLNPIGQVLGTGVLVAAGIFVLAVQMKTRDTDTGHPWRVVAALERALDRAGEDAVVYANKGRRPHLLIQLLGSPRAVAACRPLVPEMARLGQIPPGSLVLAGPMHLRGIDIDEAKRAGRQPALRLSEQITTPPDHWRLLEYGHIRGRDAYVLYRVEAPGSRPWKPVRLQSAAAPRWFLHTKSKATMDSIPREPTAARMQRSEDKFAYLVTGGSKNLGNLDDPVTCESVDRVRVDPAKLYQLRFRARGGPGVWPVVRVYVRVYEFGPRHLLRVDLMRSTYTDLILIDKPPAGQLAASDGRWQRSSMPFRLDPDTQYIRVGFGLASPGQLDVADVELRAFDPPEPSPFFSAAWLGCTMCRTTRRPAPCNRLLRKRKETTSASARGQMELHGGPSVGQQHQRASTAGGLDAPNLSSGGRRGAAPNGPGTL